MSLLLDRSPEPARSQAPAAEQTVSGPAVAPGRGPALERDPPDRLGQVLGALYGANESVAGSVISAGLSFVPGVDQVLDAGDLALNVWRVSTPEHRRDPEAWTNLALTAVGAAVPFVGDALEASLKVVMQGGPRAARALMETLEPKMRAAGIRNPAAWLEQKAVAVPGMLDRAVAGATETVSSFLDRAGRPRFGVPEWVENAAREAAGEMRSAGQAARRGVQGVSDEIAGAFRNLAAAAAGGRGVVGEGVETAGDARRGARAADQGPEPPRRDGPEAPSPGALARRVESVTSVDELRALARPGGSRTERMIAEGDPHVVFDRLSQGGRSPARPTPGRTVSIMPDGRSFNLHRGTGANANQTNYWTVGVSSASGRQEEKFRFEQWPSTGPSPLR